MTAIEALATQRARVRDAVLARLASPPWDDVAPRTLALVVRPPVAAWASADGRPAAWYVLDAADARALAGELRQSLVREGVRVEPAEGASDLEVTAFTSEGIARLLDGVTRRSLEARWTVRHAEPVHDPLHRHDALASHAQRLPADALERIARPLYLQAVTSLDAVSTLPADEPATGLVAAGEAASAIARLACVLDTGAHPPAEWLLLEVRDTRLGRRVAAWLNDLAPAFGGDARATRWIRDSAPGVLREVAAALRPEFAGSRWLSDPHTAALRPGR